MRDENKNLIIAIALSMAILLGWQYFFAAPEAESSVRPRSRQQSDAGQSRTHRTRPRPRARPAAASAPVPGTVPTSPAAATVETREAALARSPRVAIDTPAIAGSINLRGGRIDDVSLKNYHETVDPKSPNIVLFSPVGHPEPLLRGVRLGRRAAGRAAGRRHVVDGRQDRSHTLEPRDPDLGQRPGAGLPPHDLGRRQVHVHGEGCGREQAARRPSRCTPTASSPATARPTPSAITCCTRA